MTASASPAGRSAPIVRGQRVMWEGEIVSAGPGQGGRVQRGAPARPRPQSPATKNAQRALRRDADAVEDVGAEGLHVLVVAGGDDLEQFDPLRARRACRAECRRNTARHRARAALPASRWTKPAFSTSSMMARISWPSGSPDSVFRKAIGSPSAPPKESCVPSSPVSDQRPQLLDVAAARRLDDEVVHAPHRLGQPVEIVDDFGQRRVLVDAGARKVAGNTLFAARVPRSTASWSRSGPASARRCPAVLPCRASAGGRQFLPADLAQRQGRCDAGKQAGWRMAASDTSHARGRARHSGGFGDSGHKSVSVGPASLQRSHRAMNNRSPTGINAATARARIRRRSPCRACVR